MTQELDFSAYYESLTNKERQCYERQERFLQAYSRCGKIVTAAEAAEIAYQTVMGWQQLDSHMFNKRLELARQKYVEHWEGIMDSRLEAPTGNRGSDVLLMFKLKAEKPEKYREEVKVIGIEASKQMMDRLRELAAKDRQRSEQDAPAVEGDFKEVLPPPTKPPPDPPAKPPPVEPIRPTVVGVNRTGQKERLIAQRRKSQGRYTRR
jgi:hypothetical protein